MREFIHSQSECKSLKFECEPAAVLLRLDFHEAPLTINLFEALWKLGLPDYCPVYKDLSGVEGIYTGEGREVLRRVLEDK